MSSHSAAKSLIYDRLSDGYCRSVSRTGGIPGGRELCACGAANACCIFQKPATKDLTELSILQRTSVSVFVGRINDIVPFAL